MRREQAFRLALLRGGKQLCKVLRAIAAGPQLHAAGSGCCLLLLLLQHLHVHNLTATFGGYWVWCAERANGREVGLGPLGLELVTSKIVCFNHNFAIDTYDSTVSYGDTIRVRFAGRLHTIRIYGIYDTTVLYEIRIWPTLEISELVHKHPAN